MIGLRRQLAWINWDLSVDVNTPWFDVTVGVNPVFDEDCLLSKMTAGISKFLLELWGADGFTEAQKVTYECVRCV